MRLKSPTGVAIKMKIREKNIFETMLPKRWDNPNQKGAMGLNAFGQAIVKKSRQIAGITKVICFVKNIISNIMRVAAIPVSLA